MAKSKLIIVINDAPDGEIQLQRKSTGRPRKVGPRTFDIIRRQVDITPT